MALELLDVSQRFGNQLALDRVSIRVERGDCYGFLGHNGAGKTTALRIALGLMRPESGRVLIDGFDAARFPREARARVGGLVEVPGFYPHLSGPRNLELLSGLHGMGRREARAEIGRLLGLVGLGDVGRKPVGAYSQGMRQRLGLAQALLGKPGYLLLDEPTNGLDPEGIAELRGLLSRLTREEGVTVLLSSHQLSEISDICNRISLLRRGTLLVEAPTRELLAGDGRVLLTTDGDPVPLLDELKIPHTPKDGGHLLTLEGTTTGEVARKVLDAGLELRGLAPRPPSLEEVYLRYTRGAEAQAPRAAPPVDAGAAPKLRRAPSFPTLRAFRHDFVRSIRDGRLLLVLALPALIGMASIAFRHAAHAGYLAEMEAGTLASTSDVTAFEGIGHGLSEGLPLLALILIALGSQSLAADLGRGTLRNLVLRPVRRWQLAAGKGLALLALAFLSYLVLLGASAAAAAWYFDFGDAVELVGSLRKPVVLVPAAELWPALGLACVAPLPGLFAYAGLGFAVGSLTRGAAPALGLSLGAMLSLDFGRTVARAFKVGQTRFEAFLPSAYLPSPLGDTSHVQYYRQLAEGVASARFDYAATWWMPLVWGLLGFALGTLVLTRRRIS